MHNALLGFTGGPVVAATEAEVGAAEADDEATVCDACSVCDGCTVCDWEAVTDGSIAVDVGAGAVVLGAGTTVVLPRPEAPVNTTTVV